MRKCEILIRSKLSQEQLEGFIEPWTKQQGARIRRMGRLTRAYKTEGETMHWHISGQEQGMGTVEVTYDPSSGSLTVQVHDNRQGEWAGKMYENLATDIEKRAKRLSS